MREYKAVRLDRRAGTKQTCPSCGIAKKFRCYIYEDTQENIHPTVGICDRINSCGYHYPPKQFFIDNPNESTAREKNTYMLPKKSIPLQKTAVTPKIFDTIPFQYVEKYASCENNFFRFLCEIFTTSEIESLLSLYKMGSTENKEVIFWQIDEKSKVRAGKAMQYNSNTGKRNGAIYSIYKTFIRAGSLKPDFIQSQCLFGEHLLSVYPQKKVALVEAEKTAVICAAAYPKFVWVATGGKNGFSIEKLQVLKKRGVIIYPDADGYKEWEEKAESLRKIGFKVVVSQKMKGYSNGEDIADLIIDKLRRSCKKEYRASSKVAERIKELYRKNPALKPLASCLGEVFVKR